MYIQYINHEFRKYFAFKERNVFNVKTKKKNTPDLLKKAGTNIFLPVLGLDFCPYENVTAFFL